MGAKDWLICYVDTDTDVAALLASGPEADRPATEALVARLFPDHDVTAIEDGTLAENANPDDEKVYAAVWPGVSIVCTAAAAQDQPSRLAPHLVAEGAGRTV